RRARDRKLLTDAEVGIPGPQEPPPEAGDAAPVTTAPAGPASITPRGAVGGAATGASAPRLGHPQGTGEPVTHSALAQHVGIDTRRTHEPALPEVQEPTVDWSTMGKPPAPVDPRAAG